MRRGSKNSLDIARQLIDRNAAPLDFFCKRYNISISACKRLLSWIEFAVVCFVLWVIASTKESRYFSL